MLAKLTPELLDRLDVFVLEVEELFVPAPLLWEWLWLMSVPVTLLGLNTCKHSSLKSCKQFLLGTLTCSLLPVIMGMVSHAQVSLSHHLKQCLQVKYFQDCYEFLTEGATDNVQMWQVCFSSNIFQEFIQIIFVLGLPICHALLSLLLPHSSSSHISTVLCK